MVGGKTELLEDESVCITMYTTDPIWTGLGWNQRPAVIGRRLTHLSHSS